VADQGGPQALALPVRLDSDRGDVDATRRHHSGECLVGGTVDASGANAWPMGALAPAGTAVSADHSIACGAGWDASIRCSAGPRAARGSQPAHCTSRPMPLRSTPRHDLDVTDTARKSGRNA
jgi:hypothetical protein